MKTISCASVKLVVGFTVVEHINGPDGILIPQGVVLPVVTRGPQPDVLPVRIRQQEQLQSSGEFLIELINQWGAFTTSWQYWSRMKNCVFLFCNEKLFFKTLSSGTNSPT